MHAKASSSSAAAAAAGSVSQRHHACTVPHANCGSSTRAWGWGPLSWRRQRAADASKPVRCQVSARQQALLETINPSLALPPPSSSWPPTPTQAALAALALLVILWKRPRDENQQSATSDNVAHSGSVATSGTAGQQHGDREQQQKHEQGGEAGVAQQAGTLSGMGSDDLGRVVLVARRIAPPGPLRAQQERQLLQLLQECVAATGGSGAPASLGGLLLRYRSSVLLVLEGGVHRLMALLRFMSWHRSDHHGLDSPRVVSFVLDAQTRLFPKLLTADVQGRDTGVPLVMLEAQWAGAVRDVDTFVRASGARLSGLSEASAAQALREPAFFLGETLPTPATVLALASAVLGPGLDAFLDAFDLDWPVYKQALAELQTIPGAQPSDLGARVPGWHALQQSYGWLVEREAVLQAARPELASPLAHLYPPSRRTSSASGSGGVLEPPRSA